MATTKTATYKVYNGTDWDTIYFATSAAQVGESTTLKFLRPSVNTVNGKAFTTSAGITLYAGDIAMSSSNTKTVSTVLGEKANLSGTLSATEERLVVSANAASVKDSGKALETTLTNDDNKVPTSKAVYTAITNSAYKPSKASTSGYGEVKIGSNITVNDGVISISDTNVTTALGFTPVDAAKLGVASGVATLGTDGKVPSAQLPSYVDDVVEDTYNDFPEEGETGKIYVDVDTNKTYRWSGTQYVEISASLALGETSSTAYAGDKGKANATAIATLQTNYTTLDNTVKTMNTALTAAGASISSNSTAIANIISGSAEVGKATTATSATKAAQLTTARKFTIGSTGKDFNGTGNVSWTLDDINAYVRQVFEGSTTPTGMRSGDIWLQYS